MNAFEVHYRTNHRRLINLMMFKTGDRALSEDIVQETYTRYLEAKHPRDDMEAIERWISNSISNIRRQLERAEAVCGMAERFK